MQNFNDKIEAWDVVVVNYARRMAVPFARFALFLIYFYFGAIKVFAEQGAANPIVKALLNSTMPGVSPEGFLIAFGVFEMIIGILFIVPKLERLGIFLLALHIITTIMPLFVLPEFTWTSFMVPTIEGQYIIKNILIIAVAIVTLASLRTFKEERQDKNV